MKKSRILLIDDDPLFLKTTQQQLAKLGYDPETAPDGTTGDRKILATDYALILLDLRLPDTDGLTLFKSWRDKMIPSPVIMISGEGTIPEAVKAMKHGAVDFLVKPVDIEP